MPHLVSTEKLLSATTTNDPQFKLESREFCAGSLMIQTLPVIQVRNGHNGTDVILINILNNIIFSFLCLR